MDAPHTIDDEDGMRRYIIDFRHSIASGPAGTGERKWLSASLHQQFFVHVYEDGKQREVFHGTDIREAIAAYNKA
jgi:hypothetical protein